MSTKFTVGAIISTVIVAAILCSAFWLKKRLTRNYEEASTMRQRLENELNAAPPPPSTIQVRHIDAFKGTDGNFANYYQSRLTYDEIRADYDLSSVSVAGNSKKNRS